MLMHLAAQSTACCRAFHSAAGFLFLALVLANTAAAQCNTAPTAVLDSAETPDNKILWIDVLGNDTDPDGQPLTVSLVSENCPGTVATDSGGLLTYAPTRVSEPGLDCSITYRIADGAGDTDTAVVTVSVRAVPPLIFADGFESGDISAWSVSE